MLLVETAEAFMVSTHRSRVAAMNVILQKNIYEDTLLQPYYCRSFFQSCHHSEELEGQLEQKVGSCY